MEINVKDFSIDIQSINESLLNEYMFSAREVLRAIKYIADAYNYTSIVVLAQRVLNDVENINSIIKEATQNRKEN